MNEEREMVLRMLKEGKISVEEADALLQALAEEAAAPQPGQEPQEARGPSDFDVRINLGDIVKEITESLPSEIVRGLRQTRPWRATFRHVIRGLRGLEEAQVETTTSERMAPGEVLEVRNAWGDVRLVGSIGPDLQVVARKRVWAVTREEARRLADQFQVGPRRQGNRVVVGAPMAMETRRRVDLEISVPTGVAVVIDVAKGDMRGEGLEGRLTVHVARGDVEVTDQRTPEPLDLTVVSGDVGIHRAGGDLRLDVKSGDISVAELGGKVSGRVLNGDVACQGAAAVSLDVLNGDVSLAGIAGDIELEAKNGDIEISQAQGRIVRARTLSGDVQVAARMVPDGGALSAETMSGDLKITLPSTSRATLDAATMSGEITCTLPLQNTATDRGHEPLRRRTLHGVLNGPGAVVTLRTASGDIEIRGNEP